jgi:hypothetical protein
MKKLVMVDTVRIHKVRYVIEVEDDIDHALDEVVCRERDEKFAEFSQAYSGQTIISHREISKEEYLKEFDRDNDYLRDWSEEQKLNFINKIDYDGE